MTNEEKDLLIAYLVDAGELDPGSDVEEQFLDWCQVRGEVISGEVHYKAILDAARIRARIFEEGRLVLQRRIRGTSRFRLPTDSGPPSRKLRIRSLPSTKTVHWLPLWLNRRCNTSRLLRGRGEDGLGRDGSPGWVAPLHGPCPPGGGLAPGTPSKNPGGGP